MRLPNRHYTLRKINRNKIQWILTCLFCLTFMWKFDAFLEIICAFSKKSNCCPEKKCLLSNPGISGLIGTRILRMEARHHWKLQTRLTRRIHRNDRFFSQLRHRSLLDLLSVRSRQRSLFSCGTTVDLISLWISRIRWHWRCRQFQ